MHFSVFALFRLLRIVVRNWIHQTSTRWKIMLSLLPCLLKCQVFKNLLITACEKQSHDVLKARIKDERTSVVIGWVLGRPHFSAQWFGCYWEDWKQRKLIGRKKGFLPIQISESVVCTHRVVRSLRLRNWKGAISRILLNRRSLHNRKY